MAPRPLVMELVRAAEAALAEAPVVPGSLERRPWAPVSGQAAAWARAGVPEEAKAKAGQDAEAEAEAWPALCVPAWPAGTRPRS